MYGKRHRWIARQFALPTLRHTYTSGEFAWRKSPSPPPRWRPSGTWVHLRSAGSEARRGSWSCDRGLSQSKEISRLAGTFPARREYLGVDRAVHIRWVVIVICDNRDFLAKRTGILNDLLEGQVARVVED